MSLLVYYVLVPIAVVAYPYFMYVGRLKSGVLSALVISAFAILAAYDGAMLAAREYARAHDGQVTAGIVLSKTSATGLERTEGNPGRRWRHPSLGPLAEGFRPHDMLGRLVLTGSLRAWMMEYKDDCERPQGCFGRDFVPEARWRQLYAGQPVSVCRPRREIDSSRLEDNSQWKTVVVNIASAGALLFIAGLAPGHLKRRGPRYLTAPAVVTAVEPVRTNDVTRWKLTLRISIRRVRRTKQPTRS